MKNAILIIILLTTSFQLLNSQKLVEQGNLWTIHYAGFFPFTDGHYQRSIGNDTIVNDHTYYKLMKKDSLDAEWSYSGNLLREEDKVVYINTFESNEYVLYDFNLVLNDTFSYGGCNFIIVESDSIVLLDGVQRKRLKLRLTPDFTYNEQYWIEGIGTTLGLESFSGACYSEYSARLVCFQSADEQIFESNGGCGLLSNVDKGEFPRVAIYPNPTSSVLNLEMPLPSNSEFVITSYSGQTVMEGIITEEKTKINLSAFANGVYYIRLSDNNSHSSIFKVLKI